MLNVHFAKLAVQLAIDNQLQNALHVSSTTDGSANVKFASEALTGDDAQLCFNHTLALVVRDVCGNPCAEKDGSFEEVSKILRATHDFANYTLKDKAAGALLKQIQEESGKKPLQLMIDHAIRWEGLFRMAERFLDLREAVKTLWNHPTLTDVRRNAVVMLDREFWRCLKETKAVLFAFHLVSKLAQSASYPTGSSAIFWTWHLRQTLMVKEDDSDFSKCLKRAFSTVVEKRLGDFFTHVTVASKAAVLDFRFANLTLFGVDPGVIDQTWDDLAEEAEGPMVDRELLVPLARSLRKRLE